MADPRRRNRITVVALLGILGVMAGFTAFAVPIYDYFSKATGIGGTARTAAVAPEVVIDRTITVRLNADVGRHLPWRFQPAQRTVTMAIGETTEVSYMVENLSDETVTGSAVFNVTPFKMGPYFFTIACFCYEQQTLAPGERAEMGVKFFIDPSIIDNANLDDLKSFTLSYVFFKRSITNKSEPLVQSKAIPNTPPAAQEGT
jgi:cytochrome c oxidase assembly protein subunit 11